MELAKLAWADLPNKIKDAVPDAEICNFADDFAVRTSGRTAVVAAEKAQRAADAVARWAEETLTTIAVDKCATLVITLDPAEQGRRADGRRKNPTIYLNGNPIPFEDNPKLLGVTLDGQMRFSKHAHLMAAKLSSRCNAVRALAGCKFGPEERHLRHLYRGFAEPAATYAIGAWLPFASREAIDCLQSAQNKAAKAILGVPRDTRNVVALREANLVPVHIQGRREAAKSFVHFMRMPDDHFLRQLTARPRATRLKTTIPTVTRADGVALGGPTQKTPRGCWRDVAMEYLEQAEVEGFLHPKWNPPSWPPPDALPPPWAQKQMANIHFRTAGAEICKEAGPEVRRTAAEKDLAYLRATYSLDLECWTDGAAVDGSRNGVGGAVLYGPGGQENDLRRVAVPAGLLSSSTTAETVAASLGLRLVEESMDVGRHYTFGLFFDSRALFDRLQGPWSRLKDTTTITLCNQLLGLAKEHTAIVCWVPGHAGLVRNEAADETAGTEMKNQPTTVEIGCIQSALKCKAEKDAEKTYLANTRPDHLHRRATEDGKLLELENGTPREDGVLLRKLRCGRPTWLRSIAARYGGAQNPTCDRCDAGTVEDVEHFICDCSAWDHARLQELGAVRDVADLQNRPEAILRFVRRILPAYCGVRASGSARPQNK